MGRRSDARRRRDNADTPVVPAPHEAAPETLAPARDTDRAAHPPAATEDTPDAPVEVAPDTPAAPVEGAPAAEGPLAPRSVAATEGDDTSDNAEASGRLLLPSSGLAEDILRDAEAQAPAPAEGSSRTHQFTFFAAPEREAREQVEATEHLVTFFIGAEEYGVDVHLVQEIIRVPLVTAVPRAPAFVKGVVNLRGRIIPVIDFKAKLGLGPVDATRRGARILVVRLKGRLLGLLVDGASQVFKVPVSLIEAAPEEVVEIDSSFIRGVAKLERRLVILVDLLAVLLPELRAAEAAT